MLSARDARFSYWLRVFSFVSLVPLVINVALIFLVWDHVEAVLGQDGVILRHRVSMALSLSFVALIALAYLCAAVQVRTERKMRRAAAEPERKPA